MGRPVLPIVALAGALTVIALSAAWSEPSAARANALLRGGENVSSNWAGYIARGTTFTHVTGTWIQPRVRCIAGSRGESSGFWIGLGGASFRATGLEQTGTAADCSHGRAQYYAWYELIPAPPTNLTMRISPGDAIAADVDLTDGLVTFTFRNLTTGAAFVRQVPVRAPAVDSAEWIAEAPSTCERSGTCTTVPLAHFGSVLFTAASATAAGHTGTITDPAWFSESVRLASRNGVLSATPSVLSADGSYFSVATTGPRAKLPFSLTRLSAP